MFWPAVPSSRWAALQARSVTEVKITNSRIYRNENIFLLECIAWETGSKKGRAAKHLEVFKAILILKSPKLRKRKLGSDRIKQVVPSATDPAP